MADIASSLDRFFRISERGSTIGNEIKGGVITFLAMSYILIVNPSILMNIPTAADYGFNALFTATAIAAILSCLLMGLYARFPVALAPGMGVNTFLTFTICLGMGFTYPQALVIVLLSGLGFFLITVTGWRKQILNSIPTSMKYAITAGIGFFITIVGLYNAGIITHGDGSALTIGSVSDPGVILSLTCIALTIILWYLKFWWATVASMIMTWVIGLIMGAVGIESELGLIPHWDPSTFVNSPDFSLMFSVFTDFQMFDDSLVVAFVASVLSLIVVDMFDTTGTLIAVGEEAGMINEKGELEDAERALNCDAVATFLGGIVGTSTTTSFIESMTGISVGARTGLMPIVVGILFIVALFLSGFFATFTMACIVGALIMVGIIMISCVKDINWTDPVSCCMGFMTIFLMGLCGSITIGIAAGVLVYVLGMFLTRRKEEISKMMWALFVLFFAYLLLNQFILPYL